LVEQHGARVDPVMLIRELAKIRLTHARSLGWTGPPFDPRLLASCLGIALREDHLGSGRDAYIYPVTNGDLEIAYDPTRPATRQNFSIDHEIAHTLFPDGYEMIRYRNQQREKFDPDRELEYLCDVAAAELLLPEDEFRDDVTRWGLGLEAVPSLRERYQASREAVIRRMVQLDPGESAAVFLEQRLKPSEADGLKQLLLIGEPVPPTPKLRIAYAVPSAKFTVFLPTHKSIPDNSCVYRTSSSAAIERACETWDIPGLNACDIEAIAIPSGDDSRQVLKAVALLRPTQ
jgi:hypothetical protein